MGGGGATPWWQVLGGLAAVFGLLLLCLRLLGSWHRRTAGATPAALLAVWPVGQRREVQVLRLGEEVHYLYRQDGSLVHLKTEDLAAFEASRAAGATAAGPAATSARWLRRLPALVRPGQGTPTA